MAESTHPEGVRRKRRALKFVAALILLAAAGVILLLPVLLRAHARGWIESALNARLGTRAHVEELSLGWAGPQTIRGLRVEAPSGTERGEDLLAVRSLEVRSGLLGLAFRRSKSLEVEISGPSLFLARRTDGTFNFEGMGVEPKPRGPSGTPTPPQEKAPEAASRRDERAKVLPGISVSIRDGKIRYRDDLLGTASEITDFGAEVSLQGSSGRFRAQGKTRSEEGPAGKFQASGEFSGLGKSDDLPQLLFTAELRDLHLWPYRALLEKFASVRVPEKPVSGQIAANTSATGIEISGKLDAGFARLEEFAARVPAGEAERAVAEIPYSLDLAPSLETFGLSGGEGKPSARGGLQGKLSFSAPISVDDLRSGKIAGKTIEARFEAEATGLEIPLPLAPSPRSERPELPRAAPRAFSPKRLSVSARASLEGLFERIEISELSLAGDSVALEGKATLRRTSAEATGTRPRVEAQAEVSRLEVSDPELAAWLEAFLPKGLALERRPALRISNLRAKGAIGGGKPLLETLEVAGSAAISGALRYRSISVSDPRSEVRLGDNALQILGLECSVNGGRVAVESLRYGFESPAPYRLSLSAEAVPASYDMVPLLAYVLPFLTPGADAAELSGMIRGTLEIEGKGFSLAELEEHLRGKGSVRVLGGAFSASGVVREIAAMLGRDWDRTLFDEIGSDFEIGKGKVGASGVFLRGREGGKLRSLRLSGATSLDGKLDWGVELSAIRDAIGDKEARKALEVVEKVLGGGALPLRLAGTLSNPKISLDPKLGIGKADAARDLLEILRGAIPGAKPEEESAGEKPGSDAKPSSSKPSPTDELIERGMREILERLERRKKK